MTMSSRRRRQGACPERSFKRIPKIPTLGFAAQPAGQAPFLRKRSACPRDASALRIESGRAGVVQYNGSIEASQASDVGSIPIARSINPVDAVGFTGFLPRKFFLKPTILDAVGRDVWRSRRFWTRQPRRSGAHALRLSFRQSTKGTWRWNCSVSLSPLEGLSFFADEPS